MKEVIGIRLEADLIKRIKIQAIEEKRNVNEIVKELLERYLEKKRRV